jgi:hypothetical protein
MSYYIHYTPQFEVALHVSLGRSFVQPRPISWQFSITGSCTFLAQLLSRANLIIAGNLGLESSALAHLPSSCYPETANPLMTTLRYFLSANW